MRARSYEAVSYEAVSYGEVSYGAVSYEDGGPVRSLARRVGRLAVGALLAATVLAGCTSVRSSLGTSDSSCFLALPTATKAVHSHGHLIGVHLFSSTSLRHKAPHLYAALKADHDVPKEVCVVAFNGTFSSSGVTKPIGHASGHLAVVVTRTPSNALLGTVIFGHAPLHFGHPHIG
jgi:hypothetical protein